MHSSLFDVIDFSELRLWCLRALSQHPHLIHDVDGTVFISNGVAYPIFSAMRKIALQGEQVTPLNIYTLCDRDHAVGLGLIDVFVDVPISERMADTYLTKLAMRVAREAEDAAA